MLSHVIMGVNVSSIIIILMVKMKTYSRSWTCVYMMIDHPTICFKSHWQHPKPHNTKLNTGSIQQVIIYAVNSSYSRVKCGALDIDNQHVGKYMQAELLHLLRRRFVRTGTKLFINGGMMFSLGASQSAPSSLGGESVYGVHELGHW